MLSLVINIVINSYLSTIELSTPVDRYDLLTDRGQPAWWSVCLEIDWFSLCTLFCIEGFMFRGRGLIPAVQGHLATPSIIRGLKAQSMSVKLWYTQPVNSQYILQEFIYSIYLYPLKDRSIMVNYHHKDLDYKAFVNRATCGFPGSHTSTYASWPGSNELPGLKMSIFPGLDRMT